MNNNDRIGMDNTKVHTWLTYGKAHKWYFREEFNEAGDSEYTQVEVDDYDKAFKRIYGKSFMDHIEDELERIFEPVSKPIPQGSVGMKDLEDATKFLQVLHTGEDSIYQLCYVPIEGGGLHGATFKGNHSFAAETMLSAYGDNVKKMYVLSNPMKQQDGLQWVWGSMTTKAAGNQIASRRWIFIDIDVKHPKGSPEQSSTEREKNTALLITERIVDYLDANGIKEIMWGCSGNGGTALVPIDLPNDYVHRNDGPSYSLVNDFLEMLAKRYNRNGIEVDLECKDAARICPMLPAVAKKGKHTPERPHRRSYLVYMPSTESLTPELRNSNTQAIRGLVEAYRATQPKQTEQVPKEREPNEASTPVQASVDVCMEDRYLMSLPYLSSIPPAIAHSGGNNQTRDAAFAMCIYFNLDESYTLKCLEVYNERCQPSWNHSELVKFARGAMKAKAKSQYESLIGKGLAWKGTAKDWIAELGDIDFGYELPLASEPNSPESNTVGESGAHQPEPIEAKTDKNKWVQYPIHLLPKPLADYAQALSAETCFDVGGIAPTMFAISAGLIGKSRAFRVKPGWMEPCALWSCVVADSGGGKSVILRALNAFADEKDIEMRELKEAQERLDAEKAMRSKTKKNNEDEPDINIPAQHAKPMPVLLTGDATWEKEVMLIKESPNGILKSHHEMSSWFTETTKNNNDTGPYYCQLYDGETVRQDRMARGCHVIKNALLSIASMVQPHVLSKQATEDKWCQGLMPRFMIATPPEQYGEYKESMSEVEGTKTWWRLCYQLFSLRDDYSIEINISRDLEVDGKSAHDLFVEDYNSRQQRKASRTGVFKSITSKAQSWVIRLAGVLSLWSQILNPKHRGKSIITNGNIDCASMRAGIALALWHEREAIRSASKHIEALKPQNKGSLEQWLTNHPKGITARDLSRLWTSQYPDKDKAEVALAALVKNGKATSQVCKYKGGQTIKYYPMQS